MQEASTRTGITQEHLAEILKKYGENIHTITDVFSTVNDNEENISFEWQAYTLRLEPQQYVELLSQIKQERINLLKKIILSYGQRRGKFGAILQMTALDLFVFCVREGKKQYAGSSDLEIFDAVMSAFPPHRIIRRNSKLPFTLDNTLLSRKQNTIYSESATVLLDE